MQKSPATANKKLYLWGLSGLVLAGLVAAGIGLGFFLNQPGPGPGPAPTGPQASSGTGYRPLLPGVSAPVPTAPLVTTLLPTAIAGTVVSPTGGLTASPATAAGSPATPDTQNSGGAVDERYGLIVTGLENEPDKVASLNRTLELSQARWWYQYTPDHPAGIKPGATQIYMIRTWQGGVTGDSFKAWTQFIQQTGRFAKPTYWLIGNEPNTDGQDDTTPEAYAEALHEANRLIRAADPRATISGPNVLNFDDTCKGCSGFTAGRTWLDQLRKIYQSRYQSELPFDAWTIHTYNLDWEHLPLINQTQDIRQLESFRAYLDSTESTRGKPIWLSEFGVVWGFEGLEWQKTADDVWNALPRGAYRQDLLEKYLSDTLDWLENNSARLKIERWFLFTSYGEAEGFSRTFGGISLFDSSSPAANLTAFGRIYSERIKRPSAKR
jgi:hypothetical protein